MGTQKHRHSIYDTLDGLGFFARNPANLDSRDPETQESLYKGPVTYPKMLYHPDGETKVIVPANYISDPVRGAVKVDEQSELIHALAGDEEEEKALLAKGWHPSPAHAIAKREGREAPISEAEKSKDLAAQLAAAQAELAKLRAAQPKPAK